MRTNPTEELLAHFGNYLAPEQDEAWDALSRSLVPGAEVNGIVVGRFIFGVFLDIGCGFPALLPISQFGKERSPRGIDFREYPELGSVAAARIVSASGSRRQIGLTQRVPHNYLDRPDQVADTHLR